MIGHFARQCSVPDREGERNGDRQKRDVGRDFQDVPQAKQLLSPQYSSLRISAHYSFFWLAPEREKIPSAPTRVRKLTAAFSSGFVLKAP